MDCGDFLDFRSDNMQQSQWDVSFKSKWVAALIVAANGLIVDGQIFFY